MLLSHIPFVCWEKRSLFILIFIGKIKQIKQILYRVQFGLCCRGNNTQHL